MPIEVELVESDSVVPKHAEVIIVATGGFTRSNTQTQQTPQPLSLTELSMVRQALTMHLCGAMKPCDG